MYRIRSSTCDAARKHQADEKQAVRSLKGHALLVQHGRSLGRIGNAYNSETLIALTNVYHHVIRNSW